MTSIRHLRTPTPIELARALQAPPEFEPPLTARFKGLLVDRFASSLLSGGASPRRIDAYLAEHGGERFATPFSWSARSSRRPLGTAALRRVASGAPRDVLAAAFDEIDALCDRARRGLARRGALGTWLADATADVRSLCAVEATTWANGLRHLVDPATTGVAVGVADAWFTVPGARTSMCGRRDALGVSVAERHGLLRLRDGLPGPRAIDGLLVDVLVDALAAGDGAQPARVIGAWPDAGLCLVVELDDETARRAARLVISSASSLGPAQLVRPAASVAA